MISLIGAFHCLLKHSHSFAMVTYSLAAFATDFLSLFYFKVYTKNCTSEKARDNIFVR